MYQGILKENLALRELAGKGGKDIKKYCSSHMMSQTDRWVGQDRHK